MPFDEYDMMAEKFFADQKLHLDFVIQANWDWNGFYEIWSKDGILFGQHKRWWQAEREARKLQKLADAEAY